MPLTTKSEILDVLQMPSEDWERTIRPAARQLHREQNANALTATAMLGFDNVCKNQCLYCGMRAGNSSLSRYRIPPEDIASTIRTVRETGMSRLFLISGEDPHYGFDRLLRVVEIAKQAGLWVSLATGELDRLQYCELKAAGADEYALKFEMADRDTFNRLNPSTDFDQRMTHIRWVQESGLALASGNIVGYPGQTLEMAADDILLMQELQISWAPVIPYMPAQHTPLAAEGGPGSLETTWKEISILRLSMPAVRITAQLPGPNLREGLSSPTGNLAALQAGADVLFVDMLPQALAKEFRVVDHRLVLGKEHIVHMAEQADMMVRW